MSELKVVSSPKTNGGKESISFLEPFQVRVSLTGSSDLLFHRWNCESIATKGAARKGSAAKKTDDLESYVWRNSAGEICIPGEYVRMAVVEAAKFKQDPRSPRKSAKDLFKAGIAALDQLSSLNTPTWDYLDTRRVTIQRTSGISRTRPAMKVGWRADFQFEILLPEYIDPQLFYDTLALAGRVIGVGDFRPTYGRFSITNWEIVGRAD